MIEISRYKPVMWGLAATLVLMGTGCSEGSSAGKAASANGESAQKAPAAKAEVAQVSRRNIPLDKRYPAMIRSDAAVSIVARVGGRLESQHYKPGEQVRPGQLLYVIEQAPYKAELAQAQANLASAQATYENARRDNQRYETLFQKGAISQQSRDSARNTLATSLASVQQTKAALDSARINLDYTEVRAPTAGQAGLNEVNIGTVMTANTELTTVTPIDPLEVRFQLPQRDAFQLRQQIGRAGVPDVQAVLEFPGVSGDAASTLMGKLDFLGSNVDQGTSTVEARASFSNPQHLFLPGQFVRVHLQNMVRFNAFAVPQIAVKQGLMGPQVLVLDQNNQLKGRLVKLGDQAGNWQIIDEGLASGDRVVFGDPGSLSEGMTVDPQPWNGDHDANAQDSSSSAEAGQNSGA
ncbi:efflux RND transporter periplasmic adaptor subunit [Zymobacter sp. IVIA_12111.31 C1]|uniref:efflux RND transporter periplasmic adaptor subunit n=1 Tax=Zymobacter sp. IVIA_12111.31 C1 TaxID=3394854 RepID=UPI0039C28640